MNNFADSVAIANAFLICNILAFLVEFNGSRAVLTYISQQFYSRFLYAVPPETMRDCSGLESNAFS